MILLDSGTSYAKLLDTAGGQRRVVPAENLDANLAADLCCGHNVVGRGGKIVNELVALARGALRLTDSNDFVVLDVGSRDTKFVKIKDRRYDACDWNSSCGALVGFTIEMLGRYYGLDFAAISPEREAPASTCGVFGISAMFDRIITGSSPEQAVALFVRSSLQAIHAFCGRPKRVLLSGGLCDNPLALGSFPCEVEPLGRFVQLEGLLGYAENAAEEA